MIVTEEESLAKRCCGPEGCGKLIPSRPVTMAWRWPQELNPNYDDYLLFAGWRSYTLRWLRQAGGLLPLIGWSFVCIIAVLMVTSMLSRDAAASIGSVKIVADAEPCKSWKSESIFVIDTPPHIEPSVNVVSPIPIMFEPLLGQRWAKRHNNKPRPFQDFGFGGLPLADFARSGPQPICGLFKREGEQGDQQGSQRQDSFLVIVDEAAKSLSARTRADNDHAINNGTTFLVGLAVILVVFFIVTDGGRR